MKKIQLTVWYSIVLCLLITGIVKGQSRGEMSPISAVKKASVVFNLAIGAGIDYRGDYSHSPFGVKGAIEWGLWQAGPGVVTLGAEVGGSFSNGGYYTDYRSHTIIFAARSAWHYGWHGRQNRLLRCSRFWDCGRLPRWCASFPPHRRLGRRWEPSGASRRSASATRW